MFGNASHEDKYGSQILLLLLLLLLGFLLSAGLTSAVALFGVDITAVGNMMWLQGLMQVVTFLLPAVLVAFVYYAHPRAFLQLDVKGHAWLLGLAGCCIMLLVNPLNSWLTTWNDGWHFPAAMQPIEQELRQASEKSQQVMESFLLMHGVGSLLANLLVVALVPAVCEEFLFRGCLQQILVRWLRCPHIAIVLTAIIFSLAHGDVFAFLPRFFLGLVLGYLFHCSGSIVVDICAHFFNNALVVVCYYVYGVGVTDINWAEWTSYPWWSVVVCTAVAIVLFWRVFLKNRKRYTGGNPSCR